MTESPDKGATTRKAELWEAKQFAEERGIYTWMVYDVAAMSCHWFTDEVAARNFLAAVRQGLTDQARAS